MITKPVEYAHDSVTLEGYIACNEELTMPLPAVLVVHEWRGLNDYAKKRAEQIAGLGYLGFAVDMYGKGVLAKDADEAGRLMTPFVNDRQLCRSRIRAALDVITKLRHVDTNRIAVIGYCFGGLVALELARSGANLRAVATFHANLSSANPADAKNIKAKVLACHGGDDPLVPMSQVESFMQEMRNAKVDWQLVVFGNTVHSFTFPGAGNNPAGGLAYNADSDRRSWEYLILWLTEAFAI
jgi:dienelactone hydrolase